MSDKHWSMKTALEQITKCGFECEAGPLSANIAWQWLLQTAKVGPEFLPGQGVFYEVKAEAGGATLSNMEPDPAFDALPCPTCRGSGTVNPLTAPSWYFCAVTTTCPACDGTGECE